MVVKRWFKSILYRNYLYIMLKVYVPIDSTVTMPYTRIRIRIIVENFDA